MNIQSKDLIKPMHYNEAIAYCLKHPNYHIPNAEEAELLSSDHVTFWTSESLGDRRLIYHKIKQLYERVHQNFQQNVVLVKKDINEQANTED